MNYSVFGRFQWIHVDANILETMPMDSEEKKIIFGSTVLDETTTFKQEKSNVICHYWSAWVIINDSVHIHTHTHITCELERKNK